MVLRKRSNKRSKQEAEYKKLRAAFLENHPMCQAALPGCGQKSTEVHHKNSRENERLNDTEYWLSTCRSCHDWIHRNPAKARDLKLLI